MAKMMNYGVRDLILEAQEWNKRTTWPGCLQHFRLRSLVVTFHEPLFGSSTGTKLREHLMRLPASLEKLELEGPRVLAAFRLCSASKKASTASTRKRRKKQVDNEEDKDGEEGSSVSTWDMNLTHPRLTYLKIGDLGMSPLGYAPSRPKLRMGSYALLPRSLTYLNLRHAAISPPTPKEMADFPRGLETLAFPSRLYNPQSPDKKAVVTASNVHHLPPSITDLGTEEELFDEDFSLTHHRLLHPGHVAGFGIDYLAFKILAEQWQAILPKLKRFPIPHQNHSVEATGYSYILDHRLPVPDCCQWITIALFGQPPPPVWPSNLTKLQLAPPIDVSLAIGLNWLKSFPPTLVSFDTGSLSWSELKTDEGARIMATLPWTSLTLSCDEDFAFDCFHLLPRPLTTLEVNFDPPTQGRRQGRDELVSLLEKGRAALSREVSWERLRKSILEDPTNVKRGGAAAASTYILAVESGLLYGLPLGLTTLKLGEISMFYEIQLVLPPQVRLLRLMFDQAPLAMLNNMPPSLTDIGIDFSIDGPLTRWSDWMSKIAKEEATEPLSSWTLASAPNVTSMALNLPDEVAEHAGLLIPRSLRKLTLVDFPRGDFSAWLKTVPLPPTLRWLAFRFETPHDPIDSDFLTLLPKMLETLLIYDCEVNLNAADLASLPLLRSVVGLKLSKLASLEEILSLPRSLRIMKTLYSELPYNRKPFPGVTWNQLYDLRHKHHPIADDSKPQEDAPKPL